MQLLQRPPDRLDVLGVHRPVGLGHVDPETDPIRQPFELAHVAGHRFPAQPVELGDPERLDVALAGGADLLLDLELHRQAVAVPPALAWHEVARHRLEARIDVLEDARLDVMDAGRAVRRRRAFVEDPERIVLPQGDAPGEHVVLAPEPEDASFELWEADPLAHLLEPLHPPPPVTRPTTRNASSLMQGRGVGPAVPPRLSGACGARPLTAAITAPRCHGRGPAASTAGPETTGDPVRAAARGGCSRRVSRRAPTAPGSLRPDDLRYSFPSSPLPGMLHRHLPVRAMACATLPRPWPRPD